MTLLSLKNVAASYGVTPVLFGVNLEVEAGACVALLGRNGMGKTTTVRVIMGQLPVRSGQIIRFGQSDWRTPHAIARGAIGGGIGGMMSRNIGVGGSGSIGGGIGLVPEGRQIFPSLSVRENLEAFARPIPRSTHGRETSAPREGWTLARVLDLFPQLAGRLEHSGGHLSGGEQQMLAIGRALMTNPRVLILDEATEGLAPLVRETIWSCLKTIRTAGLAILIVDKNIKALAHLADRFVIIEKGATVWHGRPRDLLADEALQSRYLSV